MNCRGGGRALALAALLALSWTACAGTDAGAEPRLRVDVLAREISPGEPLRVRLEASEPLRAAEGSFLGHSVFMTGEGRFRDGWTAIPLDAEPGPAFLRIRATTVTGRQADVTKEISIAPKTFALQKLEVDEKYVFPPKEALRRIERERKRLDAIYALRTSSPLPDSPFVRPVPGEPTSVFGARRIFNGKPRSPHAGLDLEALSGTPVHAAGAGTVVLSDDLYYAGKTVIVDHGGGLFTIYAHLSEMGAAEGQPIRRGEIVGRSGATGRVTGPHLHWGARIGAEIFDPRALLDPRLFPDTPVRAREASRN